MARFRDKYRIESARLPEWDYTRAGWYFVTICTKDRECFFGEVVNGEMRLSAIGGIVAEEWHKTEQIRPNIVLDQWVVMPNHLHGIVVIESAVETSRRDVSTRSMMTPRLKSNSLGSIIGQFKSVCTKQIWSMGFRNFAWQPRFYDHIIRDDRSLDEIRNYIIQNPVKWEVDKLNPERM
jgi:putative transposase